MVELSDLLPNCPITRPVTSPRKVTRYPVDLYMVSYVAYVVANVDSDVFLWRYCRRIAKLKSPIEVKIFAYKVTDICETV